MIVHLKGTILHKEAKFVVLDIQGIGYKVFGTFEMVEGSHLGQEKSFWIHHAVREDSEDLFGFVTREELNFFEMLIGISGIGPRTALGILNVTTVSALKKAVASNDTSHLTKVSGIGRKNAEKIVLELKGKFDEEESLGGFKEEVDAIEALKSLGYSQNDARKALKEVDSATSTQDKIKQALRILSK